MFGSIFGSIHDSVLFSICNTFISFYYQSIISVMRYCIFLYLLEPVSYACNFEQDFCNWLPGNWTRTRAVSSNKDHTTGKDLKTAKSVLRLIGTEWSLIFKLETCCKSSRL